MSAEAYAEQKWAAVLQSHSFMRRLDDYGARPYDVTVAADSTPVGEVLAKVGTGGVVAVLDEDAPHGFALARIVAVDQ